MAEYRKRCKTCGRIFCYTDEDVKRNKTAQLFSGLSDLGAAAGALSGNWGGTIANQNNAVRNENKIVDYNRCPYCNSTNIELLTDEEWEKIQKEQRKKNKVDVTINANASEKSLIIRVENFINEEDWDTAEIYTDQLLDLNPLNGYVYYLRILIDNEVKSSKDLITKKIDITKDPNYKYAEKYGDENLKADLKNIIFSIDYNTEIEHLTIEFRKAKTQDQLDALIDEANKYQSENNVDLSHIISKLNNKREQNIANNRKEADRDKEELESAIQRGSLAEIKEYKERLLQLQQYGDFTEIIDKADNEINRIDNLVWQNKKRSKKKHITVGIFAVLIIVLVLFVGNHIIIAGHYKKGNELISQGKFDAAITELEKGKASKDEINEAKYKKANALLKSNKNGKDYREAAETFQSLKGYKDSQYLAGVAFYNAYDYKDAVKVLAKAQDKHPDSYYYSAKALIGEKQYDQANEDIQQYIEKNPNGKYINDANTILQEIPKLKSDQQAQEQSNSISHEHVTFDASKYNLDIYPLLSGDELKQALVGTWYFANGRGVKFSYIFNDDGTGKDLGEEGDSPNWIKWYVDGSKVYVAENDYGGYRNYEDFGEFRKIDDSNLINIDNIGMAKLFTTTEW